MGRTDYERMEADPRLRPGLRREELILEVTEAIAQAMQKAGVSQTELATRLGKTRGHVSQLLAGGRNLTLGTIAEVADALGYRAEVRLQLHGRAAARKTKPRAASGKRRAAATK